MGRARLRKWQKRFDWPWERYSKLRKAAPQIVWLIGHRLREEVRKFKESTQGDLYG